MGGLIGPGYGPIGATGAVLVPTPHDPWLCVLDPTAQSKFTLSGSSILAYTDRGVTLSAPLPQSCTLDTTNTLGGRPVVRLASTGYTRLSATTGGVTGNAPHSMFAVVRLRTPSRSLNALALFGQYSATNSAFGFDDTNQAWGGGQGFLPPRSPLTPTAGTAFVITKLHHPNRGGTWILVNGEPYEQQGQAFPQSNAYNLGPGLGIETWNGFNPMPDADVGFLGWSAECPTLRASQDMTKSLADLFALPSLPGAAFCFGDSITAGTVGTAITPNGYPTVLQNILRARGHAGFRVFNRGNPGWTTSQLLSPSAVTPQVDNFFTLRRAKSVAIISGGTNDIKLLSNNLEADVPIANLTALFRGRRAMGFTVVGLTLVPYNSTTNPVLVADSRRRTINDWMRNTALPSGLIDGLIDLEAPATVARWGDHSQPALKNDDTHPNEDGYAAIAGAAADKLETMGIS
jgi:lysophospholipase L1-like esterase